MISGETRARGARPPGGLVAGGWALALLALLFVLYRSALDAPFQLDTVGHLIYRTNLHLTELSWRELRDAVANDRDAADLNRPVARLTLALTHYWGGLEPRAYRLGNVAIHWLAALALAFLVLTVLRTRGPGPRGRAAPWLALATATLWALHPVQTNAVTYVIQRMTSLCGLFYFLAAACYLRARARPGGFSWGWGAGAMVSFALALGSKENAATLLPLIAVAEVLLLPPPTGRAARRARLALAAAGAGTVLLLLLLSGTDVGEHLRQGYQKAGITPRRHLLAVATVQARYLLVLACPDPRLLTLDGEVAVPAGLFSPPATAALFAALVLVAALAWRLRRSRPVLSFGIAWYLVSQSLEAALLPMDLYFEHRLYVPSAFFFLGVAWAVGAAARRGGWARAVAPAGLALLVAGQAWATHARNQVWADPLLLLTDTALKAPGKARPKVNLAIHLANLGRVEEAEALYAKALELGGADEQARYNLANLAARVGDRERWRELMGRVASEAGPLAWKALRELGRERLREGAVDEAAALFADALDRRPREATVLNLLGVARAEQGRVVEAEARFREAAACAPRLAEPWENLAELYRRTGRPEEEASALAEASRRRDSRGGPPARD